MRDEANALPLKVLHLGKYYDPDSGGIETVTKDLAQGAARANCAVTVLCFGRVDCTVHERVGGVDVVRTPIWKLVSSQPFGWKYVRAFLRLAGKFDIVHVHVPNMLAALMLLITPTPGKVIVHWHADVVDKGWIGTLMRPLEWTMLRRADALVATSQAYADASPQLRRFADKVHIVPIGIEDSDVFADDDAGDDLPASDIGAFAKPDLDGVPVILAVGRLVPYKGFDVLIAAARLLPVGSRIVIVGGGERRGELEAQIRQQRVGDRVLLAGRLGNDALRTLFQSAAIYCLPSVSRAEAFGVVLLEAMAHGLPIVASDIAGSGVPWVNQHEVTGLNVPIGDAQALAAALSQLLSDQALRERMGRESRRRFEAEFTAARASRRMLDLYGTLAGRRVEELAA